MSRFSSLNEIFNSGQKAGNVPIRFRPAYQWTGIHIWYLPSYAFLYNFGPYRLLLLVFDQIFRISPPDKVMSFSWSNVRQSQSWNIYLSSTTFGFSLEYFGHHLRIFRRSWSPFWARCRRLGPVPSPGVAARRRPAPQEAFDVLNFSQEEKLNIYKIVATVMHLGEMKFRQKGREEQAEAEGTEVSRRPPIWRPCGHSQLTAPTFTGVVRHSRLHAGGEG